VTQLIEVEIGGEPLFIHPQFEDEPVEILGYSGEPRVAHTGVKQGMERVYARAKSSILALATDFDEDVRNLPDGQGPKQIDVEFSLGFSTQANGWVIGATSDSTIKIKFSWMR
jgi:Trypsin-co-occurring domain 1